MLLKNPRLRDDLTVLLEAQDWVAVRSFFAIWKDEEELIDKFMLWCPTFLPHHFRDPSPHFHRRMAKAYFSNRNEYKAAPRGFSKTTLLQAGILFDCVHALQTFIAVVEKTFTEAAEVISGVREECVDNELIIAVYGDLLNDERSLLENRKSKDKDAEGDVVINGVRIRAKGFESPIRGLKSRQFRPSKIICDDLEQDEHIDSEEQRRKYESRYNKGIQPAIDVDGSIKVFGTILHEDSLLANLIRIHGGTIYRAYYHRTDDEYEGAYEFGQTYRAHGVGVVILLWAERWGWDRLMAKKADMISSGQSSNAFEQEYRNKPIAEEERKFKWAWLHNPDRRIRLSELLKKGLTLNGYAAIDAADSTKDTADYTAAVVHLIDPDANRYRVDVRNERRNANGLIDLIFEIWEKWYPHGLTKIGVEKKAFEDQVLPLLNEAKKKRGVYPVVEELRTLGRSKANRIIGGLEGRYEHGKIWLVTDDSDVPVGDTLILLDQLHNFPMSRKDDLIDAEAYLSDISTVPLKDQNKRAPHRDPNEDPWGSPRSLPYDDEMGDTDSDTY